MKKIFKCYQGRGPGVECQSNAMYAQCFDVSLAGIIAIVQATTFKGC